MDAGSNNGTIPGRSTTESVPIRYPVPMKNRPRRADCLSGYGVSSLYGSIRAR